MTSFARPSRLPSFLPHTSSSASDGPRPPPRRRREAAINPSNLYGRFQAHRGSTTSRTRASSTPPSIVFNTKQVRTSSFASQAALGRREKKVGGRSSIRSTSVRPERTMDRQRPTSYYVELAAASKKSTAFFRLSTFGIDAQILGWEHWKVGRS